MTHLTAIILTYNEAHHITTCIQSLAFADHIVVFDSHSTDDTQKLAQAYGATLIEHAFANYAAQRNAALKAVASETDWVLFVDADERVTDELAVEIRSVLSQADGFAGFRIPRHNYIFGKITLAAGWYPDYQTRLLRIGASHYDPDKTVHEVVVLDGKLGTLEHTLVHLNYEDINHFATKQRRYSQLDAEILYEKGEHIKPWTLLTMPLRHFYWRFVTLNGYRAGWHGFLLSVLMARYEFRKYRLLWALWQRNANDRARAS